MQLDTDEEENFWTFPDAPHISPQDSITAFRILAAFFGSALGLSSDNDSLHEYFFELVHFQNFW